MRTVLALVTVVSLAACATPAPAPAPSTTPAPTPAPAAPAAAAKPVAKAPQCWNGDESKFMDVGSKASISGVAVECKPTADGKSAQWMGKKH